MLVLVAILLSTSQVLAKFTSRFKDPIFPQYPNNMEGIPFRLGSMTPYHPPDKTCSPIKAHCTMRHGAKFPKEEVLEEIAKLETIKQYFIERYFEDENALNALPTKSMEVIRKIMNWHNKTSNASAKEINQHGLFTMYKLGNRWNSRLLNIVTNIKSEEDIEFNSAKEDRCKISGEEFLKGFLKLQKDSTVEKIPPFKLPQGEDHRIKLDKGKPEVKGPKVKKPEEEEVEIIYYNKVCPENTCYLIEKISNLLFPRGYGPEAEWNKLREEITSAKAKAMYMACANSYVYEYSDQEEGHAWCHLFDNNDIIMFEDMHDYQYYIKNGYNDIKTKNYGHPMMKDILQFLDKEEPKKFKLFASHTSNCLSLITGFRMFQDKEKITLENMTESDKLMSNRKWKSSLTGNYACNIMVVVYECENAKYKISEEVSIFLNETPLEMVLENEITCTQCPIEAVKKLIIELLEDIPTEEELKEYENLKKGKMVQEKIDDSNISESSVKT